MHGFSVHTIETAPDASRPALEALRSAFGFIPNVAGALATSPVLANSLVGLFGNVHGGSFDERQIQVVLLTNAVTNAASWAVAFHSALALEAGVSAADVEAIRQARSPAAPDLAALSTLARTLIQTRGHLGEQDGTTFLAQGFGRDHLLEVIAIVSASTITNYTVNVTDPPLEPAFEAHAWQPPAR